MIDLNNTAVGIEFGSTRIKAVLIDSSHQPLAVGSHEWENKLVDGIWTYSIDAMVEGLQSCFAALRTDLKLRHATELTTVGVIGISGMMHGYLPFDQNWQQLAEFRTWRNTTTARAAQVLTEQFQFNIPLRWSVAHFYQAILDGEKHVPQVAHLTTVAGYIHWRLSGKNVMGIGEASGMFPIDSSAGDYDAIMLEQFKDVVGRDIRPLLPDVLIAGQDAGILTEDGARLLDPTGTLQAGIPMAPCEGDAGTGMVATNSVRVRTGNVSAGTSDFAMVVTDRHLTVHPEIDMVTTPSGAPVAMIHCNNCTSDINAWVQLFMEFAATMGCELDKAEVFTHLFTKALDGEPDGGGLMSFNYFSGESITRLEQGRPLFMRAPDARLTVSNFMRTHLLSALATLKIGLDILIDTEKVQIDHLYGHGGFFTTPGVGQRILSAAVGVPVSVMDTASQGGPYGMAILAGYMLWNSENEELADYLSNHVFNDVKETSVMADPGDIEGFERFLERYRCALPVEEKAVEVM